MTTLLKIWALADPGLTAPIPTQAIAELVMNPTAASFRLPRRDTRAEALSLPPAAAFTTGRS
jgi:hypothetical protein